MIYSNTLKPFIAFFFLILFFLAFPLGEFYEYLSFAILLILFGIPHGALDILSIEKMALDNKPFHFSFKLNYISIIFFYLIAFLLSFIFWLILPLLAFIIFILIGSLHFRYDWSEVDSKLLSTLMACSIIFSTAVFNNGSLNNYLEFLFISKYFTEILVNIFFIGFFAINIIFFIFLRKFSKNIYYKYALVILCSFISDPIIFFICYFCCIHSYMHTYQFIKENKYSFIEILNKTKWILFFTGIIFISSLLYFDGFDFSEQIVKASFIALFSFTIPHILISYYVKSYMKDELRKEKGVI